jgi:hypothetical protein
MTRNASWMMLMTPLTATARSFALALVTILAASAATAEPIKLKLAFFSSDRAAPYQAAL